MSAYRKVEKFYIDEQPQFDADDMLYWVYIGERKANGFMEIHFRAAGQSPEVANARAELMCRIWSAVRPGDLKEVEKTLDDIFSKDPDLDEG